MGDRCEYCGLTVEECPSAFIPENILGGIRRYVDSHIQTGGFLRAVLENDLSDSFARADSTSRRILPDILRYLMWDVPGDCWGSPEKVKLWLSEKEEKVSA
jgi:ferredoxin